MLLKIIGKAMVVGALFMILPILVEIYYKEYNILAYVVPISILLALGIPCALIEPKEKSIYAKEGFIIVALCWIILSLIGALPFVISGVIPNYVEALFENVYIEVDEINVNTGRVNVLVNNSFPTSAEQDIKLEES